MKVKYLLHTANYFLLLTLTVSNSSIHLLCQNKQKHNNKVKTKKPLREPQYDKHSLWRIYLNIHIYTLQKQNLSKRGAGQNGVQSWREDQSNHTVYRITCIRRPLDLNTSQIKRGELVSVRETVKWLPLAKPKQTQKVNIYKSSNMMLNRDLFIYHIHQSILGEGA